MELLTFSDQEFQDRVELCQRKMQERGLSGMVVTGPQNLYYYANFRYSGNWTSFSRPTFFFIPASGRPLLYAQVMYAAFTMDKPPFYDFRTHNFMLGPTADDLAGIMEDMGMHKGKIGFEIGYEMRLGFQVDVYLALQKALPNASFVDCSEIIWSQRMIKSPREIEFLRIACDATSYAFDKLYDTITEGWSEREITMCFQQLLIEGGAERCNFYLVNSGEGNYSRIHGTGTGRRIVEGDYVWVDSGAVYNGYHADFSRCGEVGKITPKRRDLLKQIHEITFKTAEFLAPGVPVRQIVRECEKIMRSYGIEASLECGRIGHGFGLMVNEPPSIAMQDDTILQEGMTITIEPGNISELGMFVVEDNFLITKDGYECLSGGSRDLHLIKKK